MTALTEQKCVPCSGDAATVSQEEMKSLKSQIPEWKIKQEGGEFRLQRLYTFSDFKSALAFTQRIGEEAEKEGHHPSLLTEWGKVTVTWWTHTIQGLHQNDFIMAAKTDQIHNQEFG